MALEDFGFTISVISKAFVRLKHSNFDVQGVRNDSTGGQSITSIEFSNQQVMFTELTCDSFGPISAV